MKPLRLEFNAFGPFAQNEVVDFEKVTESGIFLICGPTGAGKTTIFDGICFALYGEASGPLRQNENFKSDFSDPSALCFVRYSFSIRDRKFEVYRAPKQQKQKKNGEMTTVASKAELTLPDQTVITGPTAVNTRLQEIIGLSAKQFKQITMLAQGDFRRFLDASSEEKQEIFRHIFDTEKFDHFTLLLEEESKKNFSQIEQERQRLSFHLKSLTNREDTNFSQMIQEEYPVVSPILDRLSSFLKGDQEKLLQQQEKIGQLEQQCAGLGIETHRLNNQRLEDLEKRKKEMEKLSAQKPEIERLQRHLKLLKDTKELLPLWQKREDELEEAKNLNALLKEKEKTLHFLYQQQKSVQEKALQANKNLEEKESLLSKIAFLQSLVPFFEEQTELKQSIAECSNNLLQTQRELDFSDTLAAYYRQRDSVADLQKQHILFQNMLQTIDEKEQLTILFRRQKEHYLSNYSLFFDAQAGILASKLEAGVPCPVCGSLEHPHPASLQKNPPTQEELRSYHDAAEKTALNLSDLKIKIEKIRQESMKSLFPLQEIQNKKEDEQKEFLMEVVKKVYLLQKQAQQQLSILKNTVREKDHTFSELPNLPDLDATQKFSEDCRRRLQSMQSVLTLHQKRLKELMEKLPSDLQSKKDAVQKIQGLQSAVAQLESFWEKTQKSLQEVLSQIRISRQAVSDLKDRIEAVQKKRELTEEKFFASLSTHFPGGQDDFLNACTEIGQIPAIETKLEQYKLATTTLSGQIQQLTEQIKNVKYINIADLLEQEQHLQEQIKNARDEVALVQLRFHNDTAHFKEIRSSYQIIEKTESRYRIVNELFRIASGNNMQRISFERYVLSFYFDAIVSIANKRLETLSAGRYILCRKKDREKFGRSSGLDLEVLDQYNGKKRPTSTLSGGESFKTALALALSLADVVQMFAGGIVIDAMFVDEGFGSLDTESLNSAVDTLLALGSDNRLVGIISHVPQLKEQIPCQIQVQSAYNGSIIQTQA